MVEAIAAEKLRMATSGASPDLSLKALEVQQKNHVVHISIGGLTEFHDIYIQKKWCPKNPDPSRVAILRT